MVSSFFKVTTLPDSNLMVNDPKNGSLASRCTREIASSIGEEALLEGNAVKENNPCIGVFVERDLPGEGHQ